MQMRIENTVSIGGRASQRWGNNWRTERHIERGPNDSHKEMGLEFVLRRSLLGEVGRRAGCFHVIRNRDTFD